MSEKAKSSTKHGSAPKGAKLSRRQALLRSPRFAKLYALGAVAVLVTTTIFWALLGARLHQANADQLVDSYLFENHTTFQGAEFPGQHTFLLKWPLFLVIKLFGFSGAAFAAFTVGLVLMTVGILAFILYRIERRPFVFGTICLALASTLLLVPAVPYAGALLPANMAMTTTRNLEYVLFIAGLYLVVRSVRLKSWRFAAAVGLLALLIASDKLFLALSVGGALLAMIVYALVKRWSLVTLAVRWLVASLAAGLIANVILGVVSGLGVTHIVGQSSAGPYSLAAGSHDLLLGLVYGGLGFFTNFGANPAYDATTIRNIPAHAVHRLLSLSGLGGVVNIVLLGGGLVLCARLLRATLVRAKNREIQLDSAAKLSALLIFATLAALGVFVATKHYYVVDARYLGIALFAVFIASASYVRSKQWPSEKLLVAGAVMIAGMLFGALAVLGAYQEDKAALSAMSDRNTGVAQALAHHPVQILAGDYWRVLPTKFAANHRLKVLPLIDCSAPRGALSSQAWHPDLAHRSFAYLLSLDRGLTDFPSCTFDQVIAHFGRPNASTLIAGSLENPKEFLLFYDHGTPKMSPVRTSALNTAAILPIDINELPNPACALPTIMSIVAHQDDDLIFMNPDLKADITAGRCVRTLYLTAGDSGNDKFYWLNREQGSEAAYSQMLGGKNIWVQRIIKLADRQYLTIVSPKGNPRISLLFMHLPDGNLHGEGFKISSYESLERLEARKISRMETVDGQSVYTSQQLVEALNTLMSVYRPTEIRTQAVTSVGSKYPDHSDHRAVGRYVQRAYHQYEQRQYENQIIVPLKYYVGYPTRDMSQNVFGTTLEQKTAAFLAYAKFDGGVCQNLKQCENTPTYGSYLKRQYQLPE